MYDLFLKLLREEVASKSIVEIQRIKLDEYREYLVNSFSQLANRGAETQKYFSEMVKKVIGDSDLLFRVRLAKYALGSSKPRESVDRELYDLADKMLQFAKLYYSSFYVGQDELHVVFIEKCALNGATLARGDVLRVKPADGLKLYLNNCAEPIVKPYVNSLLRGSLATA